MNFRHRFLLPLAALAVLQTFGMAQQPPLPGLPQPPLAPSADLAATLLPVNYRITLSSREGEKQVGELSNLTCSPRVHISGNIDTVENLVPENRIPVGCVLSGSLQEEDGIITFTYDIGMQIPVPSQRLGSGPNTVATAIQYKDVRCSGALRMKPGKTYEVFQTGGRMLLISISPEKEP